MGSGTIIREEYSAIISRCPLINLSPSLNTYSSSSSKLAEVAARVVRELGHVTPTDSLIEFISPEQAQVITGDCQNQNREIFNENEREEEEEEEFEFSFVSAKPDVTADEIFYNGKIRPLSYPLFDNALLDDIRDETEAAATVKLFSREEETSCSFSDAGKLEGVPEEIYCVWNPKEKSKTTASGMRKKSNSTGSGSKRWNLRNILLLRRSNSVDENESNDDKNTHRYSNVVVFTNKEKKSSGVGGGRFLDVKRRSYLPYRQDLIGLFPVGNGLGCRKLRPF